MEEHQWIFDVISDIKSYAKKNELENLQRILNQTKYAVSLDLGSTTFLGKNVIPFTPPVARRATEITWKGNG